MSRAPITTKITGLRQRQRADGTWRVWWEPNGSARALGFEPVELDSDRPTWSTREAEKLNRDVKHQRAGQASLPSGSGRRTMAALIALYRQDPEFTDKKPKTQASYRLGLRIVEDKWGSFAVTDFSKPIMREWYVTNRTARGETQAVRLNAMMSILFSFAELKGWRGEDSNPCFRIKMKLPKGRSRVATWPEIDALLLAADENGTPSVGAAVLMSVLQGQRQTDVMQAACEDFSQVTVPTPDSQQTVWAWRVDRSKRGTLGLMQLHPMLLDRVLSMLDQKAPDRPLLVDEVTGKGYDEGRFQSRWIAVRTAAALRHRSLTGADQLQFRDLRRTFAVWSKAGGATDDDVGDVLGNTAAIDPQLQEIYMPPSFATASRAVLSIARPKAEKRKKA